jgi:hypothetical protein
VKRPRGGQSVTAVVLAVALGVAINAITIGVLYDAIANPGQAGLSENATQILTTAFGGIIGVLGGFIGYQAGRRDDEESPDETPPPPEDDELP